MRSKSVLDVVQSTTATAAKSMARVAAPVMFAWMRKLPNACTFQLKKLLAIQNGSIAIQCRDGTKLRPNPGRTSVSLPEILTETIIHRPKPIAHCKRRERRKQKQGLIRQQAIGMKLNAKPGTSGQQAAQIEITAGVIQKTTATGQRFQIATIGSSRC